MFRHFDSVFRKYTKPVVWFRLVLLIHFFHRMDRMDLLNIQKNRMDHSIIVALIVSPCFVYFYRHISHSKHIIPSRNQKLIRHSNPKSSLITNENKNHVKEQAYRYQHDRHDSIP